MASLTEQLRQAARELEIHAFAVTSAEPLRETEERLRQLRASGSLPPSCFASDEEIIRACTPRAFKADARSVAVMALSYNTGEEEEQMAELTGQVAPYARRNYYRILRKKMEKLASWLRKSGRSRHSYLSCNGLLREKPLARRSGLGYYGNHGAIITESWGSLVVLGALVTDCELEEDRPLERTCGACRLCLEACPTGALKAPGIVDIGTCLQYLGQQPAMPSPFRCAWGTRFFGCSRCQQVCPENVRARTCPPPPEPALSVVPLLPFLELEEEQYRRQFAGTQMGARWMTLGALSKNALIALGNHGDPRAVPAMARVLMQEDMLQAEHAAWALAELKDRQGRAALEQALKNERLMSIHDRIRDLLDGRDK